MVAVVIFWDLRQTRSTGSQFGCADVMVRSRFVTRRNDVEQQLSMISFKVKYFKIKSKKLSFSLTAMFSLLFVFWFKTKQNSKTQISSKITGTKVHWMTVKTLTIIKQRQTSWRFPLRAPKWNQLSLKTSKQTDKICQDTWEENLTFAFPQIQYLLREKSNRTVKCEPEQQQM